MFIVSEVWYKDFRGVKIQLQEYLSKNARRERVRKFRPLHPDGVAGRTRPSTSVVGVAYLKRTRERVRVGPQQKDAGE